MINLKELERRLDEALDKETKDSLNSWLNSQRTSILKQKKKLTKQKGR